MIESSTLNKANIDSSARWDAEYFSPENLRLASVLAKQKPARIEDFADVTDGIHASPEWTDAGVNYLSAKCVREHAIDPTAAGQISIAQDAANPRTRARAGDVVITSVGTIGNAAVVEEWMLPANMDRHVAIVRIRNPKELDPYYLATFLNCQFGRFQTIREATGNVQVNLFIDKIKRILVPTSGRLQDLCKDVKNVCADMHKCDALYPAIEAELLERLDWDALKAQPEEQHYLREMDELDRFKRLDAEYYQPKYARLRTSLLKSGCLLKDLVERFDKGTQPSAYIQNGPICVVKSKQVTGRGISLDNCERAAAEVWRDVGARLTPNDVVINSTGLGTLGRAGVIPSTSQQVVGAVDLVIARVIKEKVHPQYLALFLNCPAGLSQSDQSQTGSSGQLHLYPQHFANFVIFYPHNASGAPDLQWQNGIAQRVEEALAAKAAAQAKLVKAKARLASAVSEI